MTGSSPPASSRPRSATAGDLVGGLRNESTHASIRHLTPPHEALRVLELLAGEIDAPFASEPGQDTNAAL